MAVALAALVCTACLAGGPAQAATKATSISVSITVVASCTISGVPGAGPACQPQGAPRAAAPANIVAREPLVTISQDLKTGAQIRTVAF